MYSLSFHGLRIAERKPPTNQLFVFVFLEGNNISPYQRKLGKMSIGAVRALSLKMRTSAFIGTLHERECSGGSAVLAGGSGEKWSVATFVFFISACLRHAVFRLP